MTEIKPIETIYNGYRFRSRLEARWAVFFDAIGADWEYEPEGFVLENGMYYLPDFLIHNNKGRGPSELWVEVKSPYNFSEEDKTKVKIFACGNPRWEEELEEFVYDAPKRGILVLGNIPKADDYTMLYNEAYYIWGKHNYKVFNLETVDGDCFECFPCAALNGGFVLNDGKNRWVDIVDKERTMDAYIRSRQARFEHGETPQISNTRHILAEKSAEEELHERKLKAIKSFCKEMQAKEISSNPNNKLNFGDISTIKKWLPVWFDKKGIGNTNTDGYIMLVSDYFRNRKYEIIFNLIANGYNKYEIQAETKFNMPMIDKCFKSPERQKEIYNRFENKWASMPE